MRNASFELIDITGHQPYCADAYQLVREEIAPVTPYNFQLAITENIGFGVIDDKKKLAGACFLDLGLTGYNAEPEAYIMYLVTQKALQRRWGIGSSLLRAAEAVAADNGFVEVRLYTRDKEAETFYTTKHHYWYNELYPGRLEKSLRPDNAT